MPVRSLSTSVLRWPDAAAVDRAVRQWVQKVVAQRPEVIRIGYFGSYARGDWGVGSDLDLVVVVEHAEERFERRAVDWDATELPVPADVLIYTAQEWGDLAVRRGFGETVQREVVWVYEAPTPATLSPGG